MVSERVGGAKAGHFVGKGNRVLSVSCGVRIQTGTSQEKIEGVGNSAEADGEQGEMEPGVLNYQPYCVHAHQRK